MKSLSQNDFVRTKDLNLAACVSLFFPVEAIDRQNPQKAEFIFKRNQELEEVVDKYWRNEIKVNPIDFAKQLKALKTRLYTPFI